MVVGLDCAAEGDCIVGDQTELVTVDVPYEEYDVFWEATSIVPDERDSPDTAELETEAEGLLDSRDSREVDPDDLSWLVGVVCPSEEIRVAELPLEPPMFDWLLDGDEIPTLVEARVPLIVDGKAVFPVDKNKEDDPILLLDGLFADAEFESMRLLGEKRPLKDAAVDGLPNPPPNVVVGTELLKDDCSLRVGSLGFPVPLSVGEPAVPPPEGIVACIDCDRMEFSKDEVFTLPPPPLAEENGLPPPEGGVPLALEGSTSPEGLEPSPEVLETPPEGYTPLEEPTPSEGFVPPPPEGFGPPEGLEPLPEEFILPEGLAPPPEGFAPLDGFTPPEEFIPEGSTPPVGFEPPPPEEVTPSEGLAPPPAVFAPPEESEATSEGFAPPEAVVPPEVGCAPLTSLVKVEPCPGRREPVGVETEAPTSPEADVWLSMPISICMVTL